ncbi:protein Faf1p [[Candida] anglica]
MSDEYMKALEIQRRNFEAQFGSIETLGFEDKTKKEESEDESDEESDETSGDDNGTDNEVDEEEEDSSDEEGHGKLISRKDGTPKGKNIKNKSVDSATPKVIKLSSFSSQPTVLSRADKKLLQSGRAATLAEISRKERELSKLTKKQQQQGAKEDDDNLENDLQLQRLLQESHILAGSNDMHSGADLTLQTIDYEEPTGKARKRTLDSRIRTLAATNSKTGGLPKKLEKMPMSMRKGMIRSHDERVRKYEEEARNAGIVLSKVKKGERRSLNLGKGSTLASDRIGTGKKKEVRIRDRGLKISSVGRSTRNGLVISQVDIDRINGKGKSNKSKGRR